MVISCLVTERWSRALDTTGTDHVDTQGIGCVHAALDLWHVALIRLQCRPTSDRQVLLLTENIFSAFRSIIRCHIGVGSERSPDLDEITGDIKIWTAFALLVRQIYADPENKHQILACSRNFSK